MAASGNERVRVQARVRVNEGRPSERRHRRSECLADALRLQLDACREDEGLAAIVVADELGFCVAHSGGGGSHDELASRLPMLADPAQRRSLDDEEGFQLPRSALSIATFSIGDARLHACAVTESDGAAATGARNGGEVLARVASGFTRLLAQ